MVRALASLPLLALVAVLAAAAEPPLKAIPLNAAGTAARWADRLGDRDYQTREQATKELDALGDAALPALDTVIATGTPEAVRRAALVGGRIRARAENARAIAPKVVDIDLTDESFGTAVAEFQKQTGYQIRVNGDQAILGKKGTFAADQEPFWTALDRFAAATGLEFDSAAGLNVPVNLPRDLQAEQELRFREVRRDAIQSQLAQLKVALNVLQNQVAATTKVLAKLTDEQRKEKGAATEKAVAELRTRIEVAETQVADLEKQFVAVTAMPPPAGTVVLRPAGSVKASAAAVVGAVRVQAVPFPGQLPQVSREVIPLLLTATPEPSLRWVRTTDAIITKATTPDGRVLAYDPIASNPSAAENFEELQIQRMGRGRRLREYYPMRARADILGGYSATPFQSLVRLVAPPGPAVTKLATVEGLLRAKVWGQPEAVVAIKGITGEAARVYGPSGVSLQAKLSPDPNDTTAQYLDLELVYDATEVSPRTDAAAADPVYIEQLPGGGIRTVRPRPRAAVRGNPYGLTLTDDSGTEYGMSLRMAETSSLSYDPFSGGNRLLRMKQQYIVRPSKAGQGPPTRLTFTAVRMREVDLPFVLTDVPVALGTMDPTAVPVPPAYPTYDR